MSQDWPQGPEGDEEEEYLPPPPPRRQAGRPASVAQRPAQRPVVRPAPPATTVAARRAAQRPAPPRRDTFPLAVTAVVLLLILGLGAVFVGLVNSPSGTTPAGNTGAPQAAGNAAPTALVITVNPQASPPAGPTDVPAPRMPLADFKKLYDDPANRPLILDVRAKDAYDQGHIVGAISFPESDVDSRFKELPKDKLIVAYCQ